MNQTGYFTPRVRPAGRGAKMRPAAERTIAVDQTTPGALIEQRANAVTIFAQSLAPRRAQRARRDKRFAFREVRRAPCELEVTAFLQARARALDRALLELAVDRANVRKSSIDFWRLAAFHAGESAIARPAIQPVVQAD